LLRSTPSWLFLPVTVPFSLAIREVNTPHLDHGPHRTRLRAEYARPVQHVYAHPGTCASRDPFHYRDAPSAPYTSPMNPHTHWQQIYSAKSARERSWYRPHLETSLALIHRVAADLSTPILDVGAGESTLVDDLLAARYTNLSVLDISEQALNHSRMRLGLAAAKITFIPADLLTAELPQHHFGLWHDRAVFHFLTAPADRATYVEQVARALRPDGHVILATFAPDGPTKCSGLPVQRHDVDSIVREFGPRFRLDATTVENHITPSGATQPFVYCDLLLR
jgi:SAM-dependent methyltransferase